MLRFLWRLRRGAAGSISYEIPCPALGRRSFENNHLIRTPPPKEQQQLLPRAPCLGGLPKRWAFEDASALARGLGSKGSGHGCHGWSRNVLISIEPLAAHCPYPF